MLRTKIASIVMLIVMTLLTKLAHGQDFTDRDLEKILNSSLKSKSQGLIYVWSPHMPLSVRGVKEVEKLAKEKKWALTILRDPYANKVVADKVASREKFPKNYLRRMESRTLLQREMSLHYPSLIAFRSGHLSPGVRGGYDDPKRLERFLALEFDKLRQPASLFALPFRGLFQDFPVLAEENKSAATPSEEICRWAPFGVEMRTAPARATSYFFRAFPNSPYVSYAGVYENRNGSDRNYILNLKTRAEVRVPGPFDPVPICESIMTVPYPNEVYNKQTRAEEDHGEFRFYSINKLLNKRSDALIKTIRLGGVYQSVSACPESGKGEIKMISDKNGATLLRLQIDTTVEPATIEMVEEPKQICKNVDIKFPMLSKDGTEISGRDQAAQTSKIWTIKDDGTCEETFNFGSLLSSSEASQLLVGKADFSYDGRQLAFHVRSDADAGRYFERPSSSMAMNVYIYNREEKTLQKVTNNYDRNSYYPVWRKDGTLVYMDMTNQGQMSFIWLDPEKSPRIPVAVDYDEEKNEVQFKRYQRLMAIGRTWFELCSKQDNLLNVDAAVLTALSLDEKECQDMVNRSWAPLKSKILSKYANDSDKRSQHYFSKSFNKLSEKDLIEYCPQDTRVTKDVEVIGDLDDTLILDAHRLIEARCISCHTQDRFNDPYQLSQNKDLVKKMLQRLRESDPAKRMPLGSSLSNAELKTLETYLNAFISDQIKAPSTGPQPSREKRVRLRISRPKDLPPISP